MSFGARGDEFGSEIEDVTTADHQRAMKTLSPLSLF